MIKKHIRIFPAPVGQLEMAVVICSAKAVLGVEDDNTEYNKQYRKDGKNQISFLDCFHNKDSVIYVGRSYFLEKILYFKILNIARIPSFQPIFFPSS